MKLQDARILVTGAGGGIGSALVAALLDEGAQVLLSGRDPATLSRVVQQHADRDRCAIFAADLTSAADRARLCEFAARWRGGISILVNNAAVSDFTLLATQSAESVDAAIATNLLAPIDLCRRLVGSLERQADAAIVNIGSVFGSIGYAGNGVYCATKFGLRGFSEALRRELADTRIRVHYFAPRATRTGFNNETVDAMNHALGNALDDPAKVASSIVAALRNDQVERVFGWPEKFFVRLNALVPRLIDSALAQKLRTIQHFARRSTTTARTAAVFIDAHRREVL